MAEIATGDSRKWTVQSVVTVGSSAGATDVTTAGLLGIHTSGEIYFNFSTSSSASVSTANDLKLGQGLTFIAVPRFTLSDSIYLHYQRVGSSNITMRLVFC